jgi:hypothetical protein
MPSRSLRTWESTRQAALDEFDRTIRSVSGRGRRLAVRQLTQAYALVLSAQFQGFCRELHNECVAGYVAGVQPPSAQPPLVAVFTLSRRLDSGNPNPGNLGADFGRFGMTFWERVRDQDVRNENRQAHLETLLRWRNAIAHDNFDPAVLGGTLLRFGDVQAWRQACRQLASALDSVMHSHLHSLTGVTPW